MKDVYSENIRRWYDRDPVLSKSMQILENSDDKTQIKIALNLIKVIIEHNIADNNFLGVDDILTAVEDGRQNRGGHRWYDIDATLRVAINMLENCPEQIQNNVAKEMANIVISKIKHDKDEIVLEKEEELF